MASARDQIIETTCTLMEMQGYHATGLNQIIKESGSPKGSLYYYFPGGKEALTIEALNRVGEVVLGRIRAGLAMHEEPAVAVASFIRTLAHHVEASGYRAGGPITTVALETASTSERLREACQAIYGGWQGAFAERLTAGGLAPEPAAAMAAVIILGIEGGIILCRTERSPEPLLYLAQAVEQLLAGTYA